MDEKEITQKEFSGEDKVDIDKTLVFKKKNKPVNALGIIGVFLILAGLTGFPFSIWKHPMELIIWSLGLIFCFFGLYKKPRAVAMAGFIISFAIMAIVFFIVLIFMLVAGNIN